MIYAIIIYYKRIWLITGQFSVHVVLALSFFALTDFIEI